MQGTRRPTPHRECRPPCRPQRPSPAQWPDISRPTTAAATTSTGTQARRGKARDAHTQGVTVPAPQGRPSCFRICSLAFVHLLDSTRPRTETILLFLRNVVVTTIYSPVSVISCCVCLFARCPKPCRVRVVMVRGDEELLTRAVDGTFYVTTKLCHLLISISPCPRRGPATTTTVTSTSASSRPVPRSLSTCSHPPLTPDSLATRCGVAPSSEHNSTEYR